MDDEEILFLLTELAREHFAVFGEHDDEAADIVDELIAIATEGVN